MLRIILFIQIVVLFHTIWEVNFDGYISYCVHWGRIHGISGISIHLYSWQGHHVSNGFLATAEGEFKSETSNQHGLFTITILIDVSQLAMQFDDYL